MTSPMSPKRSIPEDLLEEPSPKIYCSEPIEFDQREIPEIPEWVESTLAHDAELDNVFKVSESLTASSRWPLENPEKPLTFRILNSKQPEPAPEVPAPVPELVEPTEFTSDEEFFDYDSLDEPTSPTLESEVKHMYNFRRPTAEPISSWDTEKFTAKQVRAAWSLIAPYSGTRREATFEQVLLAAHSLNYTSLSTGLARQTMAPEATLASEATI